MAVPQPPAGREERQLLSAATWGKWKIRGHGFGFHTRDSLEAALRTLVLVT